MLSQVSAGGGETLTPPARFPQPLRELAVDVPDACCSDGLNGDSTTGPKRWKRATRQEQEKKLLTAERLEEYSRCKQQKSTGRPYTLSNGRPARYQGEAPVSVPDLSTGILGPAGTEGIRRLTFHLGLKGDPMRNREMARGVEYKPRDNQALGRRWLNRCCQWAAAGVALLTFLAPGVRAQTASSMNGRIVDPSGGAVPGATITLTNNATGLVRTTTSNAQGLYEFFSVPPGNYSLQATASGFARYLAQNVTLLVSTASTVNVTLGLAKVTSTVVVQGNKRR